MILAATESRVVFEFVALPDGWMRLVGLLLCAAVVYGVFWLYRREGRIGASSPLRMGLAGLRCLALAALVVILLHPVMVTYLERTTPARVVVLLDRSASMMLTDEDLGDEALSRAAAIDRLIQSEDGKFLADLRAQNELAVYDFAGRALALTVDPNSGNVTASETSTQPDRTNFAGAFSQAFDDRGSQPLAAIIVVSDGVVTEGLSGDELTPLLKAADAPLYAVGVGQEIEPPNVRVLDLTAPSIAPRGDPFELRVDLAARGIESDSIDVLVEEIPAQIGQSERVLTERNVSIEPDGSIAPLLIPVDPTREGEFLYRVSVAPQDEEALTDDNARSTVVRVMDDQLRVLLVAGRPSFEYRHLTTLFERDDTIELSVWLQSADDRALRDGDVVLRQLPRNPSELFSYDLIILHDPDPAGLDSSWAINVRRFVDEFGGGLLYQAGVQHATSFLNEPRLADLISVLPVVRGDLSSGLTRTSTVASESQPLLLSPEYDTHPLVRFHPDAQVNKRIWQALPEVWWTLPVRRTKPIAAPLLERSDAGNRTTIALATQPFGTGRVGYLGLESTWRWRSTAEPYYERFWVQMVRYLSLARRQSTSDRGGIVLESEQVAVGDPLKIEVRLLDQDYVPWHESEVTAELEQGASKQPLTLRAIPGREGWYTARVMISDEGIGRIRVPLPGGDQELVRRFRATSPDQEWQRLALDVDLLTMLARSSGGRYLPIERAATLPEMIPSKARTRVERGDEDPLWDETWVLLLLAGFLSVEWAVRRSHHLL